MADAEIPDIDLENKEQENSAAQGNGGRRQRPHAIRGSGATF